MTSNHNHHNIKRTELLNKFYTQQAKKYLRIIEDILVKKDLNDKHYLLTIYNYNITKDYRKFGWDSDSLVCITTNYTPKKGKCGLHEPGRYNIHNHNLEKSHHMLLDGVCITLMNKFHTEYDLKLGVRRSSKVVCGYYMISSDMYYYKIYLSPT
jgi:hypothetical protein